MQPKNTHHRGARATKEEGEKKKEIKKDLKKRIGLYMFTYLTRVGGD